MTARQQYDHQQPLLGREQSGPDAETGLQHSFSFSERWREAAANAMALKRVAGIARKAGGILPGLDVKRQGDEYARVYSHVNTKARISMVDYCRDKIDVQDGLSNSQLPLLLERPRPEWSKVRWINIQGLSWDLVVQLAQVFDLHPLAVEDVMHIPQRIKADYYEQHLFISLARFSIMNPSTLERQGSSQLGLDRQSGGGCPGGPSGGAGGSGERQQPVHPSRTMELHMGTGQRVGGRGRRAGLVGTVLPMELTVEQVSLFLMRDGTIISLFHGEAQDVCRPIVERLQGLKTLLTDSEDASFLANVIMDRIVDQTMPMVQYYARRIHKLETLVLTEARPRAEYTKELHLLANDCVTLRRALVPAQQLIHKLQTKAAAAAAETAGDDGRHASLLSPLTRIYLADVLDHVDTLVEDMESLSIQAKELIELIFNSISHQSNSSMQMLSIVNTVFLPLTFLAGVFGTNFQSVSAYQWHLGFWFFWGLCFMVTVTFVILLRRWGMINN